MGKRWLLTSVIVLSNSLWQQTSLMTCKDLQTSLNDLMAAQTTPIFITIRVTTTGNENLEPCGSGYKKQILYLTEGGGRIPLRLVHELSKGLILNNLHVLSLQWFACFLLIWPKWDCLFGFLCFWYPLFFKSIKITCKNFSLKIRFYIAKEKNNQRENIFGIN